ncbi:MAG: hypothetical protein ING69_10440 [Rhodocyclaceae bacterium]|nr:hypothetical protein [Rhodocyclaceae bacterium]MCA3083058.1 hypothetical protein [Rhodocyclaceae bacterium]
MQVATELHRDAVGAKFFVVSAGATKYSIVVLPDADVIAELAKRGRLFRPDIDDEECAAEHDKVGTDADGKPSRCSNVLLKIPARGAITVEYRRVSD